MSEEESMSYPTEEEVILEAQGAITASTAFMLITLGADDMVTTTLINAKSEWLEGLLVREGLKHFSEWTKTIKKKE